ncbi:DUF5723 family protein [uncultured Cytophaga sp.]|uniref:DUF5723 family protein n=1 Tax=uncultured Cytophaga sp. TaxID=160238 RepID=UPI0026112DAD|nr:DUF5723 family protein [uncultured Cytophaga sp.]
MKKLLLLFSLFLTGIYAAFGQAEGSVVSATARAGVATTFVTDYHSIGINPANLGLRTKYETKHFTFGLLETNISGFAKGVTKSQMKNYLFSGKSLSVDNKVNASNIFAQNNISLNIDVMLLGAAYQSDKFGGLAFSINDVVRSNANMSQNFTDMAFTGGLSTTYFNQLKLTNNTTVTNDPSQYNNYQNIGIDSAISTKGFTPGQIFNGTSIKAHYYRTINVAYGKEIFRNEVFNVSVGVGVKYVMGYYYMNAQSDNGVITGKVAENPLFSSVSESLNLPNSNQKNSYISPQGQGYGFDLGVTTEIYDKLKIGVSLLNVGSVKYTRNTSTIQEDTIHGLKYDNSTGDALKKSINWTPSNSFKVNLPTTLRLGASLSLFQKKLEIGGDIIVPLNKEAGNINKAIYALGGDVQLKNWIKLSSGVSIGGNFANNINGYATHVCVPLGATFIMGETGNWEISLATRDIISIVDFNGKSPLYSAGLCGIRFRM